MLSTAKYGRSPISTSLSVDDGQKLDGRPLGATTQLFHAWSAGYGRSLRGLVLLRVSVRPVRWCVRS